MENLKVKIKKLHENAVIPFYAKDGDMGMDLTAVSVEYSKEMDCYIYHTGLAFEVPKGYGMFLFPRSSNRKTESYMTNHVGILDAGYRGELLLCFKNRTSCDIEFHNLANTKALEQLYRDSLNGINLSAIMSSIAKDRADNKDIYEENVKMLNYAPYKVGERIAQLVIMPYPKVEFEEVEELSKTERGEGGHGSSGN